MLLVFVYLKNTHRFGTVNYVIHNVHAVKNMSNQLYLTQRCACVEIHNGANTYVLLRNKLGPSIENSCKYKCIHSLRCLNYPNMTVVFRIAVHSKFNRYFLAPIGFREEIEQNVFLYYKICQRFSVISCLNSQCYFYITISIHAGIVSVFSCS